MATKTEAEDGIITYPPDGGQKRFIKVGEYCRGLVMTKKGENYQWERAPSDINPTSLLIPSYIFDALQVAEITFGHIALHGTNKNTRESAKVAYDVVHDAIKRAGIK